MRKKSGHPSLHATGSTTGVVGTQRYRISVTAKHSTQVKLDWAFYGAVYDASVFDIKFKLGNASKGWTVDAPGSKLEAGALFLIVNGTTSIDVEVKRICKPGTGGNGNQDYEGFGGSLTMNFLEVGNGYFTMFGTGCSKGKIGSNGVPVRGSTFDIELVRDVPNKPCALLFGTSKDKHGNIKLPFDLSSIGAMGCFLNVSYVFPWFATTDALATLSSRRTCLFSFRRGLLRAVDALGKAQRAAYSHEGSRNPVLARIVFEIDRRDVAHGEAHRDTAGSQQLHLPQSV